MIHSPKQTLTTNISPGKGKDSHVYPLYMIACRQANIFHVFYKLSQMLWVHECKKKYYQRQCLTELLPWSRTNILSAFTSVNVLWDLVGMISLSHWNQRSAILIFCISVSHNLCMHTAHGTKQAFLVKADNSHNLWTQTLILESNLTTCLLRKMNKTTYVALYEQHYT